MDLACHKGQALYTELNPHTFKLVLFYLGVVLLILVIVIYLAKLAL